MINLPLSRDWSLLLIICYLDYEYNPNKERPGKPAGKKGAA